ncbi:DUF72 domain-containing protein [Gallaecimonas sp. GXIMD4217]|uniref:DUF72 domain-containing protein n=1 Tax=Gallaecimonas sp. GXIMD4217 TaxID=3131927 RepID=UPI00311B37E2
MLYLGCPMWSHPAWKGQLFPPGASQRDHLSHYAQVFSAVEGNTSFYALPSPDSARRWADSVPEHFRFTFKFPQAISHHKGLHQVDEELAEFLEAMAPLHAKTARYLLQLPSRFGPEQLPALAAFLDALPPGLPVAVEVRHLAFFAKGEAELALNRLLADCGADRIIMDARPVFSVPASDAVLLDAQQKKPRVPVHAVATAKQPVVRFVGLPDPKANDAFMTPWIEKLSQWLEEGLSPMLFVHSADNDRAPELARLFYDRIRARQPGLEALPEPQFAQGSLF